MFASTMMVNFKGTNKFLIRFIFKIYFALFEISPLNIEEEEEIAFFVGVVEGYNFRFYSRPSCMRVDRLEFFTTEHSFY